MSGDDALRDMSKVIRDVNEILGLSSATIGRLLLNHFHWDRDVLTGKRNSFHRIQCVLLLGLARSLLGRS